MKISSLTRPNFNPGEIPIHFFQQSEILRHLKPFFRLSKVISGVPDITFRESLVISPGFFSVSTLWTCFLAINHIVLLVYAVAKGDDFVRSSGPDIIMRIGVIAITGWSIFYSGQLVRTIRISTMTEKRLRIYTEPKDVGTLRRRVIGVICAYIIVGVGMTLALISSDIFFSTSSLSDAWGAYCTKACGFDPSALFHLTLTNSHCALVNLSANYTWIFPDCLLILLSLIFYTFYQRLIRGIQGMDPGRFSLFEIDLIREHFGILSKLVIVSTVWS